MRTDTRVADGILAKSGRSVTEASVFRLSV